MIFDYSPVADEELKRKAKNKALIIFQMDRPLITLVVYDRILYKQEQK